MKKWIVLLVTLISAFNLTGCNQKSGPDRPITAYIGDSVTTVDIIHHIGGKTIQWAAEGEDVDSLRDWVSELEYELLEFEEGHSPGDSDGGEVYEFVLTEEGYPGFSYVISGPRDCYLLIEDCWFSVSNPSSPPVTEPEGEKLTLEKVKELAQKGEETIPFYTA